MRHHLQIGLAFVILTGCGSDIDTSAPDAEVRCDKADCQTPEWGRVGGRCMDTTCIGTPFDMDCDGCDGEAYCVLGVCRAPEAGIGAACRDDSQCSPTYAYCDGVCTPYGRDGARCKRDAPDDESGRCEKGLGCDPASGRCAPGGQIGQLCLGEGSCSALGTECNFDTFRCQPRSTEMCGGTCPAECILETNQCGARAGEPCLETTECAPGLLCKLGPVALGNDTFTDLRCRSPKARKCASPLGCTRGCLAECVTCEERFDHEGWCKEVASP